MPAADAAAVTASAASSALPTGTGGGSGAADDPNLGGIEVPADDTDETVVVDLGDEKPATGDDDAAAGDGADPAAGNAKAAKQQDDDAAAGDDAEITTIPPELKHLMSDAKIAPTIQRLVQQNAAFRQFGTVRDARNFAAEFPGGVKEAVEFKAKAVELDDADLRFQSGDERQQASLAAEWQEANPQAFAGLMASATRVLKDRDPDGYARYADEVFREIATSNKWDVQLDSLSRRIGQLTDEQLADPAVLKLAQEMQWLVDEAGKKGIRREERGRVSPEMDRAAKDRKAAEDRNAAADVRDFNFFVDAANTDIESGLTTEINSTLDRLLKDSAIPAKGRARIAADVKAGIEKKLQADKGYQNGVMQRSREAKLDVRNKKAVVEFGLGRARAVLSGVAKTVIEDYTSSFIAENQTKNNKKAGQTERVDITGGQHAAVRPRKLTASQIRSMSDAEKDAYFDAHVGGGE